jgi:hypothetical protein
MADIEDFEHTDGRMFYYTGRVPHTTRDQRLVNLCVWETSCSCPDCPRSLTVKTAITTPWTWPNFAPAKFCEEHRVLARKRGAAALKRARLDGLAAWHASPEGKAAKALRHQAINGKIERAVYQAVQDLSLADGWARPLDVYRIVEAAMPPPAPGKRDTRAFRTERALNSLLAKKWLRESSRYDLAVAR